jgi:hypothetical protein
MSNMNQSPLTADDIKVGSVYRAKKRPGDDTDRVVLYISPSREAVQYDSYAVANGRHYPTVPMETFLKWASHEIDANGDRVPCPTKPTETCKSPSSSRSA